MNFPGILKVPMMINFLLIIIALQFFTIYKLKYRVNDLEEVLSYLASYVGSNGYSASRFDLEATKSKIKIEIDDKEHRLLRLNLSLNSFIIEINERIYLLETNRSDSTTEVKALRDISSRLELILKGDLRKD